MRTEWAIVFAGANATATVVGSTLRVSRIVSIYGAGLVALNLPRPSSVGFWCYDVEIDDRGAIVVKKITTLEPSAAIALLLDRHEPA